MALQNFVDYIGPKISAAWLNGVDALKEIVFENALTKETAQDALFNGVPLEVVNGGTGVSNLVALGPVVGQALYQMTQDESDAGVTPTNYTYPPGNVLRYGTNTSPGTTDMTVAIQAALSVGNAVYVPAGIYKTTTALTLTSGTIVSGDGATSVITAVADIDILTGNGISDVVVRDLALVGAASSIGTNAVELTNCDRVHVLRCDISGVSDQGVIGTGGSTYITVESCYFHGWQNKVADSSDVSFYNDCTYSKALFNRCDGGGDHGVRFQLTGNNCLADGNVISEHARYGILAGYEPTTAAQCNNTIVNNSVRDITGLGLIAGVATAGAGIYCVNVGGVIIKGNRVTNTNINTTTETLNPSGIAVSLPYSECIIEGNEVYSCAWYGIGVFTNTNNVPVLISNNIVRSCTKNAIYAKNAGYVTISNNQISNTTTAVYGIRVYGQSADVTNVLIANNWIRSGSGGISDAIWCSNLNEFTIEGNHIYAPQSRGIHLTLCDDGAVGENTVRNAVVSALRMDGSGGADGCNRISIDGGHYHSAGSYCIESAGTGVDSLIQGAYLYPLLASRGADSGLTMVFRRSVAPASGDWLVGDIVYFTAPASGGYIGAVCTTAPLTWKSFGAIL